MASHPLAAESYTARRLEHATHRHLHQTTHRTFVGPIPDGWLKGQSKQWYKQFAFSAKRAPTFTAAQPAVVSSADPDTTTTTSRIDEVGRSSSHLTDGGAFPDTTASTRSLLHSQHASPDASPVQKIPSKVRIQDERHENRGQDRSTTAEGFSLDRATTSAPVRKVRFSDASKMQFRARAQRLAARGTLRAPTLKEGQMLKAEKMLVRVEITQQSLRNGFDERTSQGIETKSTDDWREFMVVTRSHVEDDASAVLQFYKSRVIAASATEKVKSKPKIEIPLSRKRTKVNVYSSLDKTLCVWHAEGSKTTIYYLRAQCSASAVEWYTSLENLLGHDRAQTLQVYIPHFCVSLRLENPFSLLEASDALSKAAEGNEEALMQAMVDEKSVAGAIVARCLEMLKDMPEWADVLREWVEHEKIGLAWKRYDRLEWVYGAVEQKMYGTIAMQRTHDLELRPKDHYPDHTRLADGTSAEEPAPIEGFLIRLTSQKGQERSLGRLLFKRLYFTSQSQYLIFLRPTKALPPLLPEQPKMTQSTSVPRLTDSDSSAPLTIEIDPYPLADGKISWLCDETVEPEESQIGHDKIAEDEAERNFKMLLSADGFINLCDVKTVRKFRRAVVASDEDIEDGFEVDFHQELPDTNHADGGTTELDEDRVFELVMENDLVVRLQAYNKAARTEWMKRLKLLVTYWTERIKADMDLYKSTRQQNLRQLGIDERAEALVGQFAYKWEVKKSLASPSLYNMCGIAECRPIHISGTLFRKPRKHSTFSRCHVILSHGHMLIFQDTLRKRNGKTIGHIHHDRISSISLRDSYLYSGLLTEGDLLYQNQTFDSNMPGHHSLPRVYLKDGWTSTDEDAMTTFVIWHANSKSWFKSANYVDDVRTQEDQQLESGKVKTKLTRVSQLGATGRSVVFKARSRAERDHWVMAIQAETERMVAHNDEVRIVNSSKGSAGR